MHTLKVGDQIKRRVLNRDIISEIVLLENGKLGIKTAYSYLTVDELVEYELVKE